jgi:hypothetical protein
MSRYNGGHRSGGLAMWDELIILTDDEFELDDEGEFLNPHAGL